MSDPGFDDDLERELAITDRRLRLLEQIEQARRDLAPLRNLAPAELEIYTASLDMWPAGPDPLRRLLGLLRQAEDELEQP